MEDKHNVQHVINCEEFSVKDDDVVSCVCIKFYKIEDGKILLIVQNIHNTQDILKLNINLSSIKGRLATKNGEFVTSSKYFITLFNTIVPAQTSIDCIINYPNIPSKEYIITYGYKRGDPSIYYTNERFEIESLVITL